MSEMKGNIPLNLRGYTLKRVHGGIFVILKRLILVAVIAIILMYFFKREWFNIIVSYIKNLF